MKINMNKNAMSVGLILAQAVAVALIGIAAKDLWYSICVSVIGVIFNALVSFKVSYGFLVGFLYAILSGTIAFAGRIYATFAFMIVLQAPMAIYSYFSWRKNKGTAGTELKKMKARQLFGTVAAMATLGVAVYFVLQALASKNLIPDTIFFVFSVFACLLLAFRYRSAYVVTLLSGIGGTVLWSYQAATGSAGLSLAVFYGIVALNSAIAIYKVYIGDKKKQP